MNITAWRMNKRHWEESTWYEWNEKRGSKSYCQIDRTERTIWKWIEIALTSSYRMTQRDWNYEGKNSRSNISIIKLAIKHHKTGNFLA